MLDLNFEGPRQIPRFDRQQTESLLRTRRTTEEMVGIQTKHRRSTCRFNNERQHRRNPEKILVDSSSSEFRR